MTLYLGTNPIAGGGTVDQTYDGTSTNAQSGTAVAGAISNMATIDTAQTISGHKTFNEKLSVAKNGTTHCELVMNSDVAKGSTPSATEYFEILAQDNDTSTVDVSHRLGDIFMQRDTAGAVRTTIRAYLNTASSTDSAGIWVQKNADSTVETHAPACTNTNSIVTTTTRTLASASDKWGFGNGLKIATKEISPTASGDTTWNYGITFSATPVVVCCRRSGASTTTVVNGWIRGDIGTSSCKFYVTAASTWELIAIGH